MSDSETSVFDGFPEPPRAALKWLERAVLTLERYERLLEMYKEDSQRTAMILAAQDRLLCRTDAMVKHLRFYFPEVEQPGLEMGQKDDRA